MLPLGVLESFLQNLRLIILVYLRVFMIEKHHPNFLILEIKILNEINLLKNLSQEGFMSILSTE